jgi:hypothetical protein
MWIVARKVLSAETGSDDESVIHNNRHGNRKTRKVDVPQCDDGSFFMVRPFT